MLMKLRQGMLTEDVAEHLDISTGLASNIITTQVKAASTVLKPMIFVPDREVMYKTLPNQFKSMPDNNSILDGTQGFIETQKKLDL